jgi:trigger factor
VAVRREELPTLDDDFAKEIGGAGDTLAELRDNVRGDLERNAEAQAERRMRESLIDELLRDYDFSLPDTLVERQASELLRELAYAMLNNGVPAQSIRKMNWDERRGQARVRAVRDVRAALIIERIAEAEKIEVTDDEIETEIARLAEARGEAIEAVRARLTKEEALSSIENRLRHQKALDAIIRSAEVTVQEVTETQTETQAMPSEAPETLPQPDQTPEQP